MNPERYLRSFHILDLLVGQEEGLRLSEIRDALSLPASSLHNMLKTMVAAGVLAVNEDLRYVVGPRMRDLARVTVDALDVRHHARPHLEALAREIGHDAYLGLRMGRRVFYADRCLSGVRVSLKVQLGIPLYLHSTATGKLFAAHAPELEARVMQRPLRRFTDRTLVDPRALAAEYDRIRKTGWAISHEETVAGIVGYAVPIRVGSDLVGAVHVSVIASASQRPEEEGVVAAARACALRIERSLAQAAFPKDSARVSAAARIPAGDPAA
jgi:DNA-binding IclR family transcriptional regulator